MTITATEFKNNFGKYLKLVASEDIVVTKNGKTIGIFTNPGVSLVESLCGIMDGKNLDKNDVREMRLREKYGEYFND